MSVATGRPAAPPQDLEAERSVLGGVLLGGADLLRKLEAAGLVAGHFYRDAHAVTFDAARRLVARTGAVDALTLGHELDSLGELERAGGRAALDLLTGSVPELSNVLGHARVVIETALLRRRRELIDRLGEDLLDEEALEELREQPGRRDRPMRELRRIPASAVQPERVRWLVPDRVPLGALTLLAGDPGLGKSQWSMLVAANVTTGAYGAPPGVVLMANAEDGRGTVMRPRLEAVGADLDRVEFFDVLDGDDARDFTLPDDLDVLTDAVRATGARMVAMDPLNAFLGGQVDSWKDQQVRRALAPVARMADELDVAVLVVAHLNKGNGGDPVYRVQGSIGLVGGARSLLAFARDPDDAEDGSRRVLGHAKCNWGRLAPTLQYEIESVTLPSAAGDLETSRLRELGEIDLPGNGVLAVGDESPADKLEQAVEILADNLTEEDWTRASEVLAVAKAHGISRATVYRAHERASVETKQMGTPRLAWWRLQSQLNLLSQEPETPSVSNAVRQSASPGTEPRTNVSAPPLSQGHGRETEDALAAAETALVHLISAAFDATEEAS